MNNVISNEVFPPLSLENLSSLLDATIKKDDTNKVITFLSMLSAYTESSQINIMFNAPSSSGKSYIPLEISKLYPKEDLIKLSYVSPAAFFHDSTNYDKEAKAFVLNLERKILIFLDQPHTQLLERLRPLFSHDEKIIEVKIADKSASGANRTKKVLIVGYPSVVFCSAGLKFDEQEATRFILLSPQVDQDKISLAINERIEKDTNNSVYRAKQTEHEGLNGLKNRVVAIKTAGIKEIVVKDSSKVKEYYLMKGILKARYSRDAGQLISLIKASALLNLWHRERKGDVLFANDEDVDQVLTLWASISEAQEHNLPPFVFDLFNRVLRTNEPLLAGQGIERKDIIVDYKKIYGQPFSQHKLGREVLPMLEDAGLVYQEQDTEDRRRTLVYLVKNDVNGGGGRGVSK